MWDGVFVPFARGCVSTDADIGRAEDALGFSLPGSYRSFCRDCGAGLANGYFRIATPLPYEAADLVLRSELIAHSIGAVLATRAAHRFEVEGDDDSVVERACFFGEGEGGEFLFFDVVPSRADYEIWVMGADLETVRFGGADLRDLVTRTRGPAVRGILGMGSAPLGSAFEGIEAAVLARAALS